MAIKKITAKKNYSGIKIYINDILHISFLMENYTGIQSWYTGNKTKIYFIEISFKEGEQLLLEYTSFDNWKIILKLIDENL